MAVVFDQVIAEVDAPAKSATTTEKQENESQSEESFDYKLCQSLKRAEKRKLRLSAE